MRTGLIAASLLLLFVATSCDRLNSVFQNGDPSRPGGNATVFNDGPNAFSLPSANMPPSRKVDFSVGNSFFRNAWVIAPSSTTARDGLGPLFNTNACQSCHIKDGRGHPPAADDGNAVSMLVRLSIPFDKEKSLPGQEDDVIKGGVIPEPIYGGQLQDMAIPGHQAEGRVHISYVEEMLTLADGDIVNLRKPTLHITDLAYGALHPQTMTSIRVAPPMIGLGLLEAIPEKDLLAQEDADDKDSDGISGHANRVWDNEDNRTVVGRFGWKAGKPTLNQQNAGAFAGDMGLTSRVNGADDCTSAQAACTRAVNGNEAEGREASDNILKQVLFYTRNLAVPARRNMKDADVSKGEKLFNDSGCAGCHTPSFTTTANAAEPELANQVIYPYTDLLLHDMGEGLADHRSEFLASGTEWKTPPLWGLGLTKTVSGHTQFLHDGRARNVLEAILWHGGEAEKVQQAVVNMTADERNALVKFVESL